MECIQTGKPVLAAPCFADQPMNAKLVEERKFGLILRPESDMSPKGMLVETRFTHKELLDKINKLITDPIYVENIKRVQILIKESGGLP